MTTDNRSLNPELMLLWSASLMQQQQAPLSSVQSALQDADMMEPAVEVEERSSSTLPDTVGSLQYIPKTLRKVPRSSKEEPLDLTLEEIFRDHDLHESSTTLESSMDTIGDESNSDLSVIFDDDEEEDAPIARRKSSSETPVRFKPFHEEKWNARLRELIQYRSAHGNCLVPHTYVPNPQLARWVKRQRRQYKLMLDGRTSTMTAQRLEVLNEVAFVWDSHEAAWQEKLYELEVYRSQKGNCLVPSNYKKNPQLATWIKCQRRQYKLYWEGRPSAITPERILELEKLDFEWEIRSSSQSQIARSDFLYLSQAISKLAAPSSASMP